MIQEAMHCATLALRRAPYSALFSIQAFELHMACVNLREADNTDMANMARQIRGVRRRAAAFRAAMSEKKHLTETPQVVTGMN